MKRSMAPMNPAVLDENYNQRRHRDPAAHVVDNQYRQVLGDTLEGTKEPLISTLLRDGRVLDHWDMAPKGKGGVRFPLYPTVSQSTPKGTDASTMTVSSKVPCNRTHSARTKERPATPSKMMTPRPEEREGPTSHGVISESELKIVKDILKQPPDLCGLYYNRRRYMSRPRDQDVMFT